MRTGSSPHDKNDPKSHLVQKYYLRVDIWKCFSKTFITHKTSGHIPLSQEIKYLCKYFCKYLCKCNTNFLNQNFQRCENWGLSWNSFHVFSHNTSKWYSVMRNNNQKRFPPVVIIIIVSFIMTYKNCSEINQSPVINRHKPLTSYFTP